MIDIKCSAPWSEQADCPHSAGDGEPNSKTKLSRCDAPEHSCTRQKIQVDTIDLTPTPTGYAFSLIAILESGNSDSRDWARKEIIKLAKIAATINPEAWGKEEQ